MTKIDEDRIEFWQRYLKAKRYKDSKEIALDFGDPLQYLCSLLSNKITSSPEKEKLQRLFEQVNRVPNTFKSFWEFYNELMPIMTKQEREEFIESCVLEQEKSQLTPGEKDELFWYGRCTGPLLAAYERKSECRFVAAGGTESIYNGWNKAECQADFELLKDYYKDDYRGVIGQTKIERSIAMIDRIIENAPPLENDIVLYRGVGDIYSGQRLQSLKKLWESSPETLLIKDRATMSTSLTERTCYSHNKYVLEILAPAGTKGIYLETNYWGYGQQEFLLPRNTTIKIYSIAFDDSTGNLKLHGKIVSQQLSNKNIDEFAQGTNNVVDRLKLRCLSFEDAINRYNDNFNNSEVGTDITQFMNILIGSGLLDKFYDESYDMEELYRRGNGPDVIDHGVGHVQRVMLYALYLGRKLSLDDYEMDLLITATKYHDVGVYNGHFGHGKVSAHEAMSALQGKLPQKDIKRIAAIIECHEIDDERTEFISIFRNYNISEEDHQLLFRLVSILKDADALDRTRFRNNLNTDYLRNRESLELVKTSYQIQEIRGKIDLDEKIKNGSLSEEEKQQIERYRTQKIPDYVISHSLATYSFWGFSTASHMVNAWMNNPHGLVQ